jgi:medium-chain acyl-[acyl-carrier-protein] hydrolase
MVETPWLVGRRRDGARLRLFCFTWAGGSPAAYMRWPRVLPAAIEVWGVHLPGRGSRFGEPAITRFEALLGELVAVFAAGGTELPFAFFGHSMGAIVAFELTRRLRESNLPLPVHLIASAAAAPSLPRRRPAPEDLEDPQLLAMLRGYGGTPAAALGDRQLLPLILPPLRADLVLLGDHVYRPGVALPLPITVFAGRLDRHAHADALGPWKHETERGHALHWFDGGHFYLHGDAEPEMLARLTEILAAHAPESGDPRR